MTREVRIALSLLESARELSYGIHLLLILYLEREEVDTVTWLSRCSTGGKNRRITIVHQCCTIRLSTYTTDITVSVLPASSIE